MNAAVRKRSIAIAGHRTSISLEEPFWLALKEIAAAEGRPLAALIAEVDGGRGSANLSSALRVHVLETLRAAPGACSAKVETTFATRTCSSS